jgi:hypothetical protein
LFLTDEKWKTISSVEKQLFLQDAFSPHFLRPVLEPEAEDESPTVFLPH